MRVQSAQRRESGTRVKLVSAEVMLNRIQELREGIARRAFEIFEQRGRQHGRDPDDWLQAESELLYPCRYELRESDGAIILRIEVPSTFTPDQFQVSVEPRGLAISAEREMTAIRADEKDSHEDLVRQKLLRVQDLREEVDPSGLTAMLDGQTLEIRMPKGGGKPKRADRGIE